MIRELSGQSQILVVHDGRTGHLNPLLQLERFLNNSLEILMKP